MLGNVSYHFDEDPELFFFKPLGRSWSSSAINSRPDSEAVSRFGVEVLCHIRQWTDRHSKVFALSLFQYLDQRVFGHYIQIGGTRKIFPFHSEEDRLFASPRQPESLHVVDMAQLELRLATQSVSRKLNTRWSTSRTLAFRRALWYSAKSSRRLLSHKALS